MNKLLMSDLEYWTNQVVKTDELIDEYRSKMYVVLNPLSIEELYPLRELLTRQSANIHHLDHTVAKIQGFGKKKRFKFFRK